MTPGTDQFSTDLDLPAPVDEVFRHLTEPAAASEVEFTPTPAGTRLRLGHRNLPPSQAAMHGVGWQHFLPRLVLSAIGQDPGPDPWG